MNSNLPIPRERPRQPSEARRPAARSSNPSVDRPVGAVSSVRGPRETGATDWLDATVERTKRKYEAQRAADERSVQAEAVKRKLDNQFCRDLFAWFESVEMRFNNRFGSQVLAVSVVGSEGSRSVQILARPIRAKEGNASLSYEEKTSSLGLSVGFGGGAETAQTIKLVLTAGGAILAEIGAKQYTPERLGQKIIDDLLA